MKSNKVIIVKYFKNALILFFILASCKVNSQTHFHSDTAISKDSFKQTVESKFEIISRADKFGYTYKSVESNFQNVSIQLDSNYDKEYFANIITTTKKTLGIEGQERNIKIDIRTFEYPSKTLIEINKDCDEIDLQNHTYRSVKYGCCSNPNYYEIFNYNNKQIIRGNGKILTGFIPNSRLLIYASYVEEINNPNYNGILYFATTNNTSFAIKIKNKFLNNSKSGLVDICVPKITFKTNNKSDEFDSFENEYTLWSLDGIKNENTINQLTIKFKIECGENHNSKELSIPIINGKPFGKNDKIQYLIIQ
jgi:hypothetical protein